MSILSLFTYRCLPQRIASGRISYILIVTQQHIQTQVTKNTCEKLAHITTHNTINSEHNRVKTVNNSQIYNRERNFQETSMGRIQYKMKTLLIKSQLLKTKHKATYKQTNRKPPPPPPPKKKKSKQTITHTRAQKNWKHTKQKSSKRCILQDAMGNKEAKKMQQPPISFLRISHVSLSWSLWASPGKLIQNC